MSPRPRENAIFLVPDVRKADAFFGQDLVNGIDRHVFDGLLLCLLGS